MLLVAIRIRRSTPWWWGSLLEKADAAFHSRRDGLLYGAGAGLVLRLLKQSDFR